MNLNLKLLRTLIAVGLATVAGYSWATVSPTEPPDGNMRWQDISGIQWSTNNGASWGNSALYVGQTVEFKITMHKGEDGNHYVDLIKSWIDWNGNGTYANDGSETLLDGFHLVNSSLNWHADNVVNQSFDFISGGITLTSGMVGDHFLLARVTCSDALLTTANQAGLVNPKYTGYSQQWNYSIGDMKKWFSPSSTVSYYQGESEQIKFTVNNKVPEPGTLSLFAAAMVGMGLRRKRATRV